MHTFVTWLEATTLSTSLNQIAWLWPAAESLHFVGLTLVIGGAGLLDLRLLGAFRGVPLSAVRAFMPFAIAGFAVNVLTGVLFLIMAPHMYLTSGIWWAKVLFLVSAGLNALFFETRLSTRALALEAGRDTPLSLKLVGGLSLVSWFGVLYCGRMLPYLGSGN